MSDMLEGFLELHIARCRYERIRGGGLVLCLQIAKFHQCLIQGLWPQGNPKNAEEYLQQRDLMSFSQLPHIGLNEIKKIKAHFKDHRLGNLRNFLNLSQEVKENLLQDLTKEQREDIHNACCVIPRTPIPKIKVCVEDEDKICVGDIITIEITLNRQYGDVSQDNDKEYIGPNDKDLSNENENNADDLEKKKSEKEAAIEKQGQELAPYIHAPYYPYAKKEQFWIFLSNSGNVFYYQKTDSKTRKVTATFKLPAPPDPNEYPFQLDIVSDSYFDLHYTIMLRIPVHPAPEDDTEVHPEDAALDDQPTLQQMLFNQLDTGSDSEDEGEEEEEHGEEEQKNGVDNEPFMKETDPSEVEKNDKDNNDQNTEENEETDDEGDEEVEGKVTKLDTENKTSTDTTNKKKPNILSDDEKDQLREKKLEEAITLRTQAERQLWFLLAAFIVCFSATGYLVHSFVLSFRESTD